MDKLISIGRLFFAIALCGLGIEHFIYKDFIVGRAPIWPEAVSGKLIWAYVTGSIFTGISIAVFTGKKARLALIIGGLLILLWALLRHIPIVASASFLFGEWTSAGKALTFIGGMLVVASTFPKIETNAKTPLFRFINLQSEFIITAQVCLGIFMIICGIQHFMFLQFVATLIPAWFPGNPVLLSKLAGVALIAGGIGLFIPAIARWAAFLSGVMIFLWFWVVHIPRISVSVSDSIAVFEALAFSGVAFVIAGCLHEHNTRKSTIKNIPKTKNKRSTISQT